MCLTFKIRFRSVFVLKTIQIYSVYTSKQNAFTLKIVCIHLFIGIINNNNRNEY
nr:MAG TPA: hypothetical protein [Caudoviricetes sp.]